MKTLSSYVNECLLTEEKGDGNFFKKTRTTILLQDNLKNFLKHLSENSISLKSKTDLKKVYNAYTMFNLKNGFLSGESFKNATKEFHLDTAVGFGKFLYDNTQKLKDLGYNTDAFKDFNLSKNELAYRKWKNSKDYTPGKEHDNADLSGLDNHRIMVVYSRYDPSLHDEYDYTGAVKSNSNQIHMLRMKFHYDYGVKYYECYNCLLDTYMKKSKEELEHQDIIGEDD